MALAFGVCAAIGAVLGLRFKVLILIPSIFLVTVGIAVVGTAVGWKPWSIVGTVVISVTALQIGYLIGVVARAATSSFLARAHAQIAVDALSQHQ